MVSAGYDHTQFNPPNTPPPPYTPNNQYQQPAGAFGYQQPPMLYAGQMPPAAMSNGQLYSAPPVGPTLSGYSENPGVLPTWGAPVTSPGVKTQFPEYTRRRFLLNTIAAS